MCDGHHVSTGQCGAFASRYKCARIRQQGEQRQASTHWVLKQRAHGCDEDGSPPIAVPLPSRPSSAEAGRKDSRQDKQKSQEQFWRSRRQDERHTRTQAHQDAGTRRKMDCATHRCLSAIGPDSVEIALEQSPQPPVEWRLASVATTRCRPAFCLCALLFKPFACWPHASRRLDVLDMASTKLVRTEIPVWPPPCACASGASAWCGRSTAPLKFESDRSQIKFKFCPNMGRRKILLHARESGKK